MASSTTAGLDYLAKSVNSLKPSRNWGIVRNNQTGDEMTLLCAVADEYESIGKEFNARVVRWMVNSGKWPMAAMVKGKDLVVFDETRLGEPGFKVCYLWYKSTNASIDITSRCMYIIPEKVGVKLTPRWPGSNFSMEFPTLWEAIEALIEAVKKSKVEV